MMTNEVAVAEERSFVPFNRLFFRHDFVQHAYKRVSDFHSISWRSKSPDFMVLYGESGCGKTKLLKRYKDEINARPGLEENELRVLYVSVPSGCSPKALAESILSAIGDPRASSGTQHSMTLRAIHYIREKNVSLIILDEFQHFINKQNMRVVYDAADWLKSLADAVECPFLACGLPQTLEVLSKNEQLERRVVSTVEIPKFPYSTKKDRSRFGSLLALFANELPFDNPHFVISPDVAASIHHASSGIIGRIARLLRNVGEVCMREGVSVVEKHHFEKSYDEFLKLSLDSSLPPVNPFSTVKRATQARVTNNLTSKRG